MSFSQQTSPPDYFLAVASGTVKDAQFAVVTGSNNDLDAVSSPEDLIPGGGFYSWLSVATALSITSLNVEDTAAGTGARTVLVAGLDARYLPISEVVVMNGTTPVPLTRTYLRVNSMRVVTAGSATTNVGDIIVHTTVGANMVSQISPGYGRSQVGIYTVPATHNGFLLDGFFSITVGTSSENVTFTIFSRAYGQAFFARSVASCSAGTPTLVLQPRATAPLSPGSDLFIRISSSSAANMQMHATMSILLTLSNAPLLI